MHSQPFGIDLFEANAYASQEDTRVWAGERAVSFLSDKQKPTKRKMQHNTASKHRGGIGLVIKRESGAQLGHLSVDFGLNCSVAVLAVGLQTINYLDNQFPN